MKIENNGADHIARVQAEGTHSAPGSRPAGRTPETGAPPGAGTAPATGSLSGRDQATLSDRARLLGKARAALEEVPALRTDRVDPLRQQIQAGRYQIAYGELASRLLPPLAMM